MHTVNGKVRDERGKCVKIVLTNFVKKKKRCTYIKSLTIKLKISK